MRFRISSLTGLFASFATGGVVAKVAQHRDKNDVIARLHGVHLTQIHAIIGAVDKTLLKPEPLSPKSIEAEFVPF